MDVNRDIYRKSIGNALIGTDDLYMIEAVDIYTGQRIGATFFRGKKPVNGIWVTYAVFITGTCMMPPPGGSAQVVSDKTEDGNILEYEGQ